MLKSMATIKRELRVCITEYLMEDNISDRFFEAFIPLSLLIPSITENQNWF